MTDILTRELLGKTVVRADGTTIGPLCDVTVDSESGTLRELVVDQPRQLESMVTDEVDDNRLRIPVSLVKTIDETVVITID